MENLTLWMPNFSSSAEEREPRPLGIMTLTLEHRVKRHDHDLMQTLPYVV